MNKEEIKGLIKDELRGHDDKTEIHPWGWSRGQHIEYKGCPVCQQDMPMVGMITFERHSTDKVKYRCMGCLKLFQKVGSPRYDLEEVL